MKITVKRRILDLFFYVFISCISAFILFIGTVFVTDNTMGINITNATVIARVNVSNTEPSLYSVRIDSAVPIDLTPNSATTVLCNGSVSDINGFDDIKNVSAAFYDISVQHDAPDDNNTHYTNSSCGACTSIPGSNNQNGSCLCQFAVQYYANPASWRCRMLVNDSGSLTSSFNSSAVTVNEVIGINIESNALDYGNLSVTQISNAIRQNVTNTGNIPINISVRGFGGDDESIGQNLSMICGSGSLTNISFDYQRYSTSSSTPFADMVNLTNQSRQVAGVNIPQRTTEAGFGNSSNSTFWKLQVPVGASGICNGTIIFGALRSTP